MPRTCPHCGQKMPRRGAAVVFSLVMPGLGQFYRGHPVWGLLWLVAVAMGYALAAAGFIEGRAYLFAPGPILHFLCALSAGRR